MARALLILVFAAVAGALRLPSSRVGLAPLRVVDPTTVIDASYNLAGGSAVIGTLCGGLEDLKGSDGQKLPTAKLFGGAAVLFTLFGAFIAFQTTTLRFTFDDTSFALVKADGSTSGENVVVGGENRWAYKSFTNYDFLPSESFPILVYFRETQTPVEVREEVPLVVDNAEGQVHFFPAIANSQQLKEQFEAHNCKKL
jgi:NIMA (never in mitosis gene a)-related kinase